MKSEVKKKMIIGEREVVVPKSWRAKLESKSQQNSFEARDQPLL